MDGCAGQTADPKGDEGFSLLILKIAEAEKQGIDWRLGGRTMSILGL